MFFLKMTENADTYEWNPGKVISDFMKNYNTPEAKKKREEAMKSADEIIHTTTGREISDLKNDMIFSCLRTDERLYKNYANSIKEHPEYQKYLQIYNYNWKDFLIVPVYDISDKCLRINTVEIGKDGGNLKIISKPYWIPDHPYTRESNVITVPLEDKTQKYWYHRVSMNKWTWEISDVEPSEYSMDEKWINWLIDVIGEKVWKKFSDCSEWMQSNVRDIISNEGELKQKSHWFEEQKKELIQNIIQWNFPWAVSSFIGLVKSFFGMKQSWKVTNIWKWLDYVWDESDFEYLVSAIDTVLDPEQRSKLTYLLSKIKDKRTKEDLKEKWVENPSQFDLLLQQLKPWQIMLTNGLNESEWKWTIFDSAIQTVSGSRWCHSLIIEDVIKDSNWRIIDANIIQSTYKWVYNHEWGVHKIKLKEYVQGRFSSADFLVADLPEDKREKVIQYANEKEGQPYDPVSVVSDTIFWMDFDKWFSPEEWNWNFMDNIKWNLLWNNKAYCSELVFDAMEKSGLKLPQPHVSPSDLLMTDELTPQYACYCENF